MRNKTADRQASEPGSTALELTREDLDQELSQFRDLMRAEQDEFGQRLLEEFKPIQHDMRRILEARQAPETLGIQVNVDPPSVTCATCRDNERDTLATKQKECDSLRAAQANMEVEGTRLREELEGWETRCQNLEADFSRLQEELEESKVKNQELEDDRSRLQRRVCELRDESHAVDYENKRLKEQVAEWQMKARGTELMSKHIDQFLWASVNILDGEITKKFIQLRFEILLVVETYCNRRDVDIPGYRELPDNLKDYWPTMLIADALWGHFFKGLTASSILPERVPGPSDLVTNELGSVSNDTLVRPSTWRTSVPRKAIEIWSLEEIDGIVETIRGCLEPFLRIDEPTVQGLEGALTGICARAFSIAYIFRKGSATYAWLQGPVKHGSIPESEMSVLGSGGVVELREARGNVKTVFGAVAKRIHLPRNSDATCSFLRKAEVLLGPSYDNPGAGNDETRAKGKAPIRNTE